MQMTPAEILDAAADHVEKVGWIQGSLYDYSAENRETSRCCAIGALEMASGVRVDPRLNYYAMYEARRILADHLGTDSQSGIPNWNDDEERTQGEVVTALREAAKKAAA